MAGKKVVIPREKEIPLDALLAEVGLTVVQWETYLTILETPNIPRDKLPGGSPDLDLLVDRGLLRPSLERPLGYAPIPPGTAFSAMMEQYEDRLLQNMRAGMKLRRILRGISESKSGLEVQSSAAGIEVYDDIRQVRDRNYELNTAAAGARHVLFQGRYREDPKFRVEAGLSAASVDNMLRRHRHRFSVVFDRNWAESGWSMQQIEEHHEAGEAIYFFPGTLDDLSLTYGSHLVLWRDPHPSRAASLVITSPWALAIAYRYVEMIIRHSRVWQPPSSATPGRAAPSGSAQVGQLLSEGLTDEQIARRTGWSSRTVGRHVAGLLADLGASTRFEAGVLLERQRLTRLDLERGHNFP